MEDDNKVKLKLKLPYTYALLTNIEKKDTMDHMTKKSYSFDINKINQIFDVLLKDKQIKLSDGHRILSKEEIKEKKYCK